VKINVPAHHANKTNLKVSAEPTKPIHHPPNQRFGRCLLGSTR